MPRLLNESVYQVFRVFTVYQVSCPRRRWGRQTWKTWET